ncbi:hypothetical protein ABZT17_20690 [Streptomyces sp. NPDC005648]|uniref:hypothetical protein n=1 Tax=Streptomyces sp. NPDC005648 TaxID=3157044 RepID=UPI0033B1C1BA
MPYPPPSRALTGPRRRTLFASVAGAALLVGCSGGSGESEESSAGSPSVAERVRTRAARDSVGLVERYDAVIAAHPSVAERVRALRAEVVRHAEAFGGTVGKGGATASASSSASPSASPSDRPSPSPSAPATERDALVELATAERALADRRTAALVEVPGELARLLASVAAAGAVHAYLLTEGAR